ncbi:TetR/AcrR family transcriptional regulator [Brooklawnia cerclae]|uniref:AcrR family transcriptional regulator n=1 Tax=Brooklawnia cerclae TaxID=349934 RepID=A0ABX0SN18_9ACTN|nr:TetR/AcrR family transcriptional regulator [Brooklawnia cerclae]NIH58161.1 AcrR family transcriptional regulator [Brooklawnia cerclae]
MTTEAFTTTGSRRDRGGRPTDEELTTRILEIGADLLHEQGFAALSVGQVARDAGCGKAAIYRRYPGKAALVAAIIESRARLGEAPDTGSVREDLLAHVLQNQSNQEGLGFATGRGMQAMFEPEVYPILWDSIFRLRRERGVAIIARGVARGELPDDVDADVILDALAGLTLYRQAVKGIRVDRQHFLNVIDALLVHPPRLLTGDIEGD